MATSEVRIVLVPLRFCRIMFFEEALVQLNYSIVMCSELAPVPLRYYMQISS